MPGEIMMSLFESVYSMSGVIVTVAILPAISALMSLIYVRYFDPLRHVPGPLWAKISPLYLYAICYFGTEGSALRAQHHKLNTTVLQVAPNTISISDPDAIREIYMKGGGFPKDKRYRNFNLGPIASIFSALDLEYRTVRAKAVAPLFAPSRLRAAAEKDGVIRDLITRFVQDLQQLKKEVGRVDILDLCARLSADVVTLYLLGQAYGGLDEHINLPWHERADAKLTINPFIFSIVAFSRFSLLPNAVFRRIYAVSSWLSSDKKAAVSAARMNSFIGRVMATNKSASVGHSGETDSVETSGPSTYQARLLEAGISQHETAVQSTAIVFAGADSTAVMLTTILFHLVQNPESYNRLKEEVHRAASNINGNTDAIMDPQTLPYLRAVVKEGLRLGQANPTRLTRVVPESGLQVGHIFIPSGTVVGCAASVMHFNPRIFPEPFSFRPERWVERKENVPELEASLGQPADMEKSMMPYGAGLRACIGKNLAQRQLHETIFEVAKSGVLDGARTCQDKIRMREWFNGEIEGHHLDIEW